MTGASTDPAPRARRAGLAFGALLALFALAGPWLTPTRPSDQFAEFVYAPPMRPHLFSGSGAPGWPAVYPLTLENRLEHRYVEDRSRPMPLRLFRNGAVLSVDARHGSPWFPLGADALGRDELARLAWGTRLSLGVALLAALGALVDRRAGRGAGRLHRRPRRRRGDAGCRPHHGPASRVRGARVARLDAARYSQRPRSSGRWSSCLRRSAGRSQPAASGRSWPPNEIESTQKLRGRWGPAVRGYCYVT